MNNVHATAVNNSTISAVTNNAAGGDLSVAPVEVVTPSLSGTADSTASLKDDNFTPADDQQTSGTLEQHTKSRDNSTVSSVEAGLVNNAGSADISGDVTSEPCTPDSNVCPSASMPSINPNAVKQSPSEANPAEIPCKLSTSHAPSDLHKTKSVPDTIGTCDPVLTDIADFSQDVFPGKPGTAASRGGKLLKTSSSAEFSKPGSKPTSPKTFGPVRGILTKWGAPSWIYRNRKVRSNHAALMTSRGGSFEEVEDATSRQEYEAMERWLDEHPEFVHDYFARKAQRSMVDGWLIAHALSDTVSTSSAGSRTSSGANTPVRKISAQEFERGGVCLNPILTTVDGNPTFLTSASAPVKVDAKARRRSKSELKALDEKELMYELVIDICNDLDVTSLAYKILQNLCILLNADRCSLFLVQGRGTQERQLVSKLFDVSPDSKFEDVSVAAGKEIKIPWGMGIIGWVAKTGDVLNIPDAYQVSEI